MNKRARLLTLLPLTMLAGCWQSKGALYAGVTPATPFAGGSVLETGRDELGKPLRKHFALSRSPDGSYRLISTDSGEDNAGHGFLLRFFRLADSPAGTYIYEAAALDHCDSRAGCDPVKKDDDRWYGLARLTAAGAEEIRPDCTKDIVALAPGRIEDTGGACRFADRAALEQALGMLARENPPAVFSYRFSR